MIFRPFNKKPRTETNFLLIKNINIQKKKTKINKLQQ